MISYRVIRDGRLWRVATDDGTTHRRVRAANGRVRFWWTEEAARKWADEMNDKERAKEKS